MDKTSLTVVCPNASLHPNKDHPPMARYLPMPLPTTIAAPSAGRVLTGFSALVVNMGMVEIQRQAKAG
jgi:hypothetical protein